MAAKLHCGILVYFHCAPGTGYAIGRLEQVFYRAACEVTGDPSSVYFAYPTLQSEQRGDPPVAASSLLQIDPITRDPVELQRISRLVKERRITAALGFDQQPGSALERVLRQAGVRTLVSYWGAPMSGHYSGIRLLMRQWMLRMQRHQPDYYVFESEAMRQTATQGRGVQWGRTAVIRLGVDTDRFKPVSPRSNYAQTLFGLPPEARIVFYSGHMEPRKGVAVIMQAAIDIVCQQHRNDIYFVILGNRPNEDLPFRKMLAGSGAEAHVVFGGYRDDVVEIIQSATIGVIASVGWDSFTRSAVEIAACGKPLVVSSLPGLDETVVPFKTGYHFQPGNHEELSSRIIKLIDDPELCSSMGAGARHRVESQFSERYQQNQLASLFETRSGADQV